jgi:hypothetical protein
MKNKVLSYPVMFLLLLVVLSWLTACKKDPNKTVIQGHVTVYGTNKPVPGARIYLWCYNGEIFGPTGSTFVDSLVTDATGGFHTEYRDRDLCGGIYLSAYKEGYYYKNDLDIHSGVNDLEIVLDPEAWVKVVTIPDVTGNSISFTGTFTGASGWSTDGFQGTREFVFDTRGNRLKEIWWTYTAPPITYAKDTFFLVGGDTTVYTIHY